MVQQIARATGLGAGAEQFIKVLAGYIFNKAGGVSGLLQKFENAGLGDIAKSWTAGNGTRVPLTPARSAAFSATRRWKKSETRPT